MKLYNFLKKNVYGTNTPENPFAGNVFCQLCGKLVEFRNDESNNVNAEEFQFERQYQMHMSCLKAQRAAQHMAATRNNG